MIGTVKRFRIFAVLVGIGLLVLVGIAVPLKYLGDEPAFSEVFSPIHGFLYILYLLTTVDLARRADWSLPRTVGVMLAGAVPFLSFVVERRVVRSIEPVLGGPT